MLVGGDVRSEEDFNSGFSVSEGGSVQFGLVLVGVSTGSVIFFVGIDSEKEDFGSLDGGSTD